jgi:hypothetical protein
LEFGMKKYILILFVFLVIPVVSFCGEKPVKKKSSLEFRQEFLDLKINIHPNTLNESLNLIAQNESRNKSLFLAGIFSAILPGAGEFYTESYIKSGLFFVIEAASWIVNIKYNKKGDDQTVYFQNYADAHWSVVKYAQWVQKNLDNFVSDETYRNQCKALFQNLFKSGSNPWQRVDFNDLNAIERIIGANGVHDNGFSHSLPGYGEQQYYELIGKYPQFRQGWDEADPNDNQPYLHVDSIFAQFKWYSKERGKANDYYTIASTFTSIIIANHIVSALDAVLSAYLYNKAHISMSYQTILQPSGKLTVNPFLNLQILF